MTTTRLQDRTVLIVDDDPDILGSIELAVRSEGARTLTAADGNAALAALSQDDVDVVVLDMMLPKRSGFLVLEKIKAEKHAPLVVMVTANQGKRHMEYAGTLGVDDYLLKPVPLQRLVDTLVRLIDERAAS